MNSFRKQIERVRNDGLYSNDIETLQVNLGYYCNQSCSHCHLECSPHRTEMMLWPTMELVVAAAKSAQVKLVDITGGAPELNPHFTSFAESLYEEGFRVQVRTNLTVLTEPGKEGFPEFLKNHNIELAASLPCYTQENVCAQRGEGAYEKSIIAMKQLNAVGYGLDPRLPLNLICNPLGPSLPGPQADLEGDYRKQLMERFGIAFTHLLTITNMPIGRFEALLAEGNRKHNYIELLRESFNPETIEDLMCRHQISVGWDGSLYDCDFNLALGLPVNHGSTHHIGNFNPEKLKNRQIVTGNHCFGCTAGAGSSCKGALV